MVLSVIALSGYGMAANSVRGGETATYNPGVGGPNDVVVTQDKPVVFRGEDNVRYVTQDGTEVNPSNLIGVSGDAEGIPLESPIPEDQTLGQYARNGQRTQVGVTVQQPRVTDLELLNERGADVADSSITEDEVVLVRAEWNFRSAEDLDIEVRDEDGNEITGDVLGESDQLSDGQIQSLNGPYANNPAAVGNPGQRGTGTEIVHLQGIGQFNESELNGTSVQDAFWVLDMSDQDAGQYTIAVEGWDELDFGPAQQSATLDVTTDTDIQLDLGARSATRGQYVPFTIRGSSAGETHFVTIEDDDFRNNNVNQRVFRDVNDVVERGTFDANNDSTADFAYARVVIDEDTGLGEGQIDTAFLDDTNVDVNAYESGLTLEEVAQTFGSPEDDSSVRIEEGGLSIAEPAGSYIAGQEVDVSGFAEPGIDDVALYARDQGDWELLDVNEDGDLDDDDLISVDADGEWEERDVRLSVASDIFAIPGRYRFGVIEAEDARDDAGNLRQTLTTTQFSSGSSEQTSLLVTEPGLGPANQSNVAEPAGLGGDVAQESVAASVQQPQLQQQQQGPTGVQRPLIYQSYNGQVATDDGTVDVIGTAPGQDDVLLIMVDTRGRVATEQVTVDDDDIFEEDDVSLTTPEGRQLNEGQITGLVYALGRDAVAGDGLIPGQSGASLSDVENYVQRFSGTGLTQQQVLEILADETVDEAGSDDLLIRDSFRYTDGSTNIQAIRSAGSSATGVNPIEAGSTMVVSGVTNRKPDDNTISIDVTEGPDATEFSSASTDEWNFTGQWSVRLNVPANVEPGTYTLEADDGDNTDIVTFQVVEAAAPGEGTATPSPDGGTESPAPDEGTATPTPDEATVTGEVVFDDQTTDSGSVVVNQANLPEGGYIVIHDSSLFENDSIESVVGATSYLRPGEYGNQTVDLDEEVNESGTYVAMLHQDTNDNDTLDFVDSNGADDGPYVVDGEAVTDDAEVTFESG